MGSKVVGFQVVRLALVLSEEDMSSDPTKPSLLKDLSFPLGRLQERGFKVVDQRTEPRVADRFDLLPMTHNILNFFNDNRAQHLRFAEFDDETVLLEREGQNFRLFGAEFQSAFIESVADKIVYCEVGPASQPGTPLRLFVNSDICTFARCQAFFESLIMKTNSRFIPYENLDRIEVQKAYHEIGNSLRSFVMNVDPPAMLEETYWFIRQDLIVEGGFKLNPGIEYYSRRGRVRAGSH